MRRWPWNIFCALSLLVFVASVTLWVRSYLIAEQIAWSHPSHRPGKTGLFGFTMSWSRGIVEFQRAGGETAGDFNFTKYAGWYHGILPPSEENLFAADTGGYVTDIRMAGFQFLHYFRDDGKAEWSSVWSFIAPLWLFLPAGIPPFLWWRKWKRKRRGRGFPVGVGSAAEESRDREVREDAKTAAKS